MTSAIAVLYKKLLILCLLICHTFLVFSNQTNESKADSIIREVIAGKHHNRALTLQAQAYLKNTLILDKAPKRFLGKRVRKLLKLRTDGQQVLYIYESESDLFFSRSGHIKEHIKSYKNFGDYRGAWQFNEASDMHLNFNDDYIHLRGFGDKKFISPIATNAFEYYDFSYSGKEKDKLGNTYHIIKAYPKKLFYPAFFGSIYIHTENLQISKLSLNLRNNAAIGFIGGLNIEQNLTKIDSLYYPTQTVIKYHGGGLGFLFSGNCTAVFNYFTKNIADDSIFEKHEVLKIEPQDENSEKSIVKNRPVKLSSLEHETYRFHDSLKTAQGKKKYLDSLDKISLRQRLYPLLFNPYKIQNTYRNYTIQFDAIAPALFYNTVEGPGIKYGVHFIKYIKKNGSYYSVNPEFRYGFKNKELNSDVSLSWLYQPEHRGIVNFSFGSTYLDLNPNGSLGSVYNSLNTLLFEQNFMKLFRKQYFSMSSGREIMNGLYFSGGIELSKNISVSNMFDYSFRDVKQRNFTSNNPLDITDNGKVFPTHTSFRLSGTLIYTFNQTYIYNEGVKIYKVPERPRIILNYKKGLPNVFGSETEYDFLEVEVQQEKLDIGLWGYSSFSLSAGKFFSAKTNYFPDWKHFIGNMALIFNPGLKSFHLLDFYAYSTDKRYIEGHFEHNYNAKFLGTVPLLRRLKLQELTGTGILIQPDKGIYFELYAGVKRAGMRADYAFSFDKDGLLGHRFRFSFRLQNPYRSRNSFSSF